MKLLSYVVVLAIGFGLGVYVARGPAQDQVKIEEPQSEAVTEAPTALPKAPAAQAVVDTAPSPAIDMTLMREDFENQINSGNFRQANLVLIDMQKADARSQVFLESQARYFTRKRDFDLARSALKSCLTAFPKSKLCLVDLADVEMQAGSKEEQAAAIDKCLATMPTDPQCRNLAGINSMSSGDYAAAIKIYQDLIRDNGSYGFSFSAGILDWQLALALQGAGRMGEAMDYFEKACQANFSEACDKLEEFSGGGVD